MATASGLGHIAWLLAMLELSSCIAEGPPLSARRQTDDDAGGPPITVDPRADGGVPELGAIDPHALVGVDPARGPFSGGQARIVRGNGFAPGLRVWFGPNEVPKADIIPIDPSRAQVTVPAGTPGPVDVKAQIGSDASTARLLVGGYTYEDFYADPNTGPTSGGTIVHLYGQGTAWAAGTTVTIDSAPCQPVDVLSATELTCTSPQGTAGAKSVTVTAPNKVSVVREGFTYADSNNGFRGGLAGGALASQLTVLVLDDYTGAPVPGAYVLAGDDVATGLAKTTGASGVVVFNDPMLAPKRSVTIAAKCYQPTTFVDVPVDSVTAYLSPVLSPACISDGDPPSVGGRGIALSNLYGELVWGVDGEFRSAAWGNLPAAIGTNEKLAAYVFTLSGDPTAAFYLPDASLAVRPDAPMGKVGFPFLMQTILGNLTLYALAGIEDRTASPPKFTAYVMGIVRGVSASPGQSTSNIYIPMNIRLDHAVTLVAKTPDPGPRGPDRAGFTVAVELQRGGYAILPASAQSWVMPVDRSLSFVGMPALSGPLSGARYIASGLAGTGPLLTSPLSEVGFFASTDESIALDTFVPVPTLSYPSYGGAWNGQRLTYAFAASARPVDLTVINVSSGGGLVNWLVAAPGGTRDLALPNLSSAFPLGALIPGNVQVQIAGASIDAFEYGQLRYRQLDPRGFNAYSLDVFPARSP
jgi:IPT/TIG domain